MGASTNENASVVRTPFDLFSGPLNFAKWETYCYFLFLTISERYLLEECGFHHQFENLNYLIKFFKKHLLF